MKFPYNGLVLRRPSHVIVGVISNLKDMCQWRKRLLDESLYSAAYFCRMELAFDEMYL